MSCRVALIAVLWAVLWAALWAAVWIVASDHPKSVLSKTFLPKTFLPKTVGAFRCLAEGLLARTPRPGAA